MKKENTNCPCTGVALNKKTAVGAAVMVVWTWLASNIWHGVIMADIYQNTAYLWRPVEQMQSTVGVLTLGLLIMGVIASVIFQHGYKGGGWKEGARFGLTLSLLFVGVYFIIYATQPFTKEILVYWFAGDLLVFVPGGIALAKVFDRK